jgi:hypothetical protein
MNGRGIFTAATAMCCAAGLACGFALANDSSANFDTDDAIDRPITTMVSPISAPEATDQALGGNPLWGIPLEVLNATRERPVFSPSRRPPMAAVISPPVKAAPPPPAPEPTLNLLGTVKGNGEGYAILMDATTHNIVRLKMGDGEDGWILRSVKEREAVLEKNDRTEVLELPPIPGVPK